MGVIRITFPELDYVKRNDVGDRRESDLLGDARSARAPVRARELEIAH